MKALQISAPGQMNVVEIERPVCKKNEVLVKIRYVGFCGSDLNTYRGLNPMVNMPVIPGHEIGATIEAIGDDVPAGFETGMNVTINPYTSCGQCASCRNGRVNACENNQTMGVQRNGAICEYVAVPWEKIIPVGNISTRHSALIEPMSVGFHAISRAHVTDNDIVMVIGCGMIGLGAVVRASHRGAVVIAVDIDDEKLALAKRIGATHSINSKTQDIHEELDKLTSSLGPDVVIEAVGSPQTYVMAVNEVAFTGRVVCIGYAKQEIAFQTKYFVQKEMDICGSRNALPADFRAVIAYLNKGVCPLDELISKESTLDQAHDIMKEWQNDPGKIFRILVRLN